MALGNIHVEVEIEDEVIVLPDPEISEVVLLVAGNIGPQGEQGETGLAGADGEDGLPGADGADGNDGAPGADGNDGAPGADGADGSVWRDGSGAPSSGLGVNGDYYLDDVTGNVYLKLSGTYNIVANIKGATGSTGAAGADGADGADGDDGATGATGATGSTGATGAPGSVWRDGLGAPSSGLGVNGDYYLDDLTGDVYLKATGTYSIAANIKGTIGATGSTGADGAPGADGADGADGTDGTDMDPSGWVDNTGTTWTYVSGSGGGTATFTVSGDVSTIFTTGVRIRLKQGGAYKYFYVITSSYSAGPSTTTVTIFAGTSHTLANASITDNYYSRIEEPLGFPQYFAYVPAWTGTISNPAIGDGLLFGVFSLHGRTVHCQIGINMGSSTTYGSGIYAFGVPIIEQTSGGESQGLAFIYDNSTGNIYGGMFRLGSITTFANIAATNLQMAYLGPTNLFTFAVNDQIRASIIYKIAP